MIQQARRAGKSWFAEQFKTYCKAHGLSLYIMRPSPGPYLFIDKQGVKHEVANPRGLQMDACFIDEALYESADR